MRLLHLSHAAAAVAALIASSASAQPTATLDRFRAGETPEDDFHLSRPTDLGHLRFGAQLTLDYGHAPLVYERTVGASSTEELAVVEHQLVGNVGLSLGLFDRVVVYGGLPLVLALEGDSPERIAGLGVAAAGGAGLGDAYLGARVRILGDDDDLGALAAQATVTFPTADVSGGASYRGEPTLTVLPEVIGELRPGFGLRIVANVGVRVREESDSARTNLRFGHELTYALGAAMPVWTDAADEGTHLDVLAQIYGDTAFAQIGERESTALEATLGARFFHACGAVFGVAAGPGLARGFGTPDVRAVAMVGWAMPASAPSGDGDGDGVDDATDTCPAEPEDVDGFDDADGCPDRDNDRDGIADSSDECPVEGETPNAWRDQDGCPDAIPGDADHDGVRDDGDACADRAEDRDGHEDADGCPDTDDDADGVSDDGDRCPRQAGPASSEGCPVADRDGDGVADASDTCPDEPGTAAQHGCREAQPVVLEQGRLEITETVRFESDSDRIAEDSFPLLENVARVLNAHPEIAHVVVEGHTDERGTRERNVELGQRRAEAVVRFLIERGGVGAQRLEALGVGPDRPRVASARTPEEHAQNRRVEFRIP